MATAARRASGFFVTEAPGVDRPSLLQLPQLIDKAIHLRQELAMPAVAHAIEELDELVTALPEHCGLSTSLLPDEVLRRVEAPQLRHRLSLAVDDLLLEPARIERPVGRLFPQLLRQLLDPLQQSEARLLVRQLRLALLSLMHRLGRREPHVEVSLESISVRFRTTRLPHSVAKIELQLHLCSARLMLLLLHLRRELAEMYHLTRRCLIGAATTANRRGAASSGHHVLRRIATQPRAQGVDQAPLASEVHEGVERSGRPFASRRRGGAVDNIALL